jgi:hypothetical protein
LKIPSLLSILTASAVFQHDHTQCVHLPFVAAAVFLYTLSQSRKLQEAREKEGNNDVRSDVFGVPKLSKISATIKRIASSLDGA